MLFFRLILLLSSAFLIVSPLLYLYFSKDIFYSFIVAFVSSSIVVLSSFKTYKDMVLSGVESYNYDDRDYIDKIDDKFDLYDNEQENLEDRELKDIIKEQKEALKANKPSLKESLKNSKTAFNYKRLLAYAILVLGFFILLKSNNLNIFSYLLTLILPNIIVVFYLLNFSKVRKK